MTMTSLLKSSMNGLLGSSSEVASEGARRATGEVASQEAPRRDPEVVAIAKRRQFSGSEKRRQGLTRRSGAHRFATISMWCLARKFQAGNARLPLIYLV